MTAPSFIKIYFFFPHSLPVLPMNVYTFYVSMNVLFPALSLYIMLKLFKSFYHFIGEADPESALFSSHTIIYIRLFLI